MNTHKEEPKFKVGDRVVYGDTEWDILSISKAGTVSLVHSVTRNRTVVSEDSLTLKEYEFDCPHYHRIKGLPWCNYCNFVKATESRPEEEVEPTPPSQIEEEKLVLTLLELWEEYPGEPVGESVLFEPKGTIYSKDSFSGFMEWLRNNTK